MAATEQMPTDAEGQVSAVLQERTREFTALYEREAYVVYNLALRIACEPGPALTAASRAFLSVARAPDDRAALVAKVVEAALAEAPPHPVPSGAGDPDAQGLLGASAAIGAPDRAALALESLHAPDTVVIAEVIGVLPDAAAQLLERARASLAAATGRSLEETQAACRAWPLASPPDALWENVYAGFYRGLERELRAVPATVVGGYAAPPPAQSAAAERPATQAQRGRPWWRLRGTGRRPRRGARRHSRRVVATLTPLVAVGGGLALSHTTPHALAVRLGLTGGSHSIRATGGRPAAPGPGGSATGQPAVSTTPAAGSVPPLPGPVSQALPRKPLTPQELDRLRLNELSSLKRYASQQQNPNLSPAQRRQAAQQVAQIEALAQQRLAQANQRAQQLAQQLAHERALRLQQQSRGQGSANTSPSQAQNPQRPSNGTTTGASQTTGAANPSTPAAGSAPPSPRSSHKRKHKHASSQQTCLYDMNSGAYICPQ